LADSSRRRSPKTPCAGKKATGAVQGVHPGPSAGRSRLSGLEEFSVNPKFFEKEGMERAVSFSGKQAGEDPFVLLARDRRQGVVGNPLSLGDDRQRWGDLGRSSQKWLQKLQASGIAFWRISEWPEEALLAAGERCGERDRSQCFWSSALAANPLYVAVPELREWGLLTAEEADFFQTAAGRDWEFHAAAKDYVLRRAARHFFHRAPPELAAEFFSFAKAESGWLEPYALFQALHRALGKCRWQEWPEALRERDHRALACARQQLQEEIPPEKLLQFFLHRQWSSLRTRARALGIRLIASVPLWLEASMADVWLEAPYFFLDARGMPTVGAMPRSRRRPGRRTGEIFPGYRWQRMGDGHYAWWAKRLEHLLRRFDGLYIEDFADLICHAGFSRPAAEEDRRYVPGPGIAFFQLLQFHTRNRLCIADAALEAMVPTAEWDSLKNLLSTFFREKGSDMPLLAPDQEVAEGTGWQRVCLSGDALPALSRSGRKRDHFFQKCRSALEAFRIARRLWQACFLWQWKRWRQKRLLGTPLYLRIKKGRQRLTQAATSLRNFVLQVLDRKG